MRKIFFSFFLVTSYLFLVTFPAPAAAFSLSDLFPPLQMSADPQYGNPPATDVTRIGAQGVSDNTYINALEESTTCHSYITTRNDWAAPQIPVYDDQGNKIGEKPKYPYDARDLKRDAEFKNLSNQYTRLVGAQYSNRNTASVDPQVAAKRLISLDLDGPGYLQKVYSAPQKQCLQGQAVEEVIKSLNEQDTEYADIQLGWEKGGQFVDMLDESCTPATCRPVTVGEIAYYFYKYLPDTPFLFEDCSTLIPKPFPPFDFYPTKYQSHFKKTLVLFSDPNIYLSLREFLPLKALGPSRQKVVLSNYNTILSPEPNLQVGEEVKDPRQRLIPFGAAGNPKLSNQLSSITSPRDFASPFTCDNYVVTGSVGPDIPNSLIFHAYVNGLVKVVTDQPTYAAHFNNPLAVVTENNAIEAAANTANDFANLIPAGEQLDQLKKLPASSKVTDESPIDPGYQSVEIFKKIRCYLLPISMQNNLCPPSNQNI